MPDSTHTVLSRMNEMENRLTARIAGLEDEVKKTAGLVEAWDTMKSGGKFIRWAAGVAAGAVILWNAIRIGVLDHFTFKH